MRFFFMYLEVEPILVMNGQRGEQYNHILMMWCGWCTMLGDTYYVNIKLIAETNVKRGRWVLKWSRATSIWACDWTIHWTGLGTQMSVLRIFLEPKPNQSYCGLSEKLLFDRESITQHIILLCAVGTVIICILKGILHFQTNFWSCYHLIRLLWRP